MPWFDLIAVTILLLLFICITVYGVAPQHRPSSPWGRLFERAPDRPRARAWPEVWGYSPETGGPLPGPRPADRKRKTD